MKIFLCDSLMYVLLIWQSDLKLKKFLHIIENSPVFPVIYDSERYDYLECLWNYKDSWLFYYSMKLLKLSLLWTCRVHIVPFAESTDKYYANVFMECIGQENHAASVNSLSIYLGASLSLPMIYINLQEWLNAWFL